MTCIFGVMGKLFKGIDIDYCLKYTILKHGILYGKIRYGPSQENYNPNRRRAIK